MVFKTVKFYFDPEVFRFVKKVFSNLPEGSEWILIDRYRLLELAGGGWEKAID